MHLHGTDREKSVSAQLNFALSDNIEHLFSQCEIPLHHLMMRVVLGIDQHAVQVR